MADARVCIVAGMIEPDRSCEIPTDGIDAGAMRESMASVNDSFGRVLASSNAKWVVIGVCALMIVMGGVFSAVAADAYRDGEATRAWPSTTGQILTADVEESVRQERRDNGSYRERRTYTPKVTYAYAIQGVDLAGHRIRADDMGGDRDHAFDAINEYPVGSIVDVYYNPDDPGSSVLQPGADTRAVWLFGGMGGLFVILGLAGLIRMTLVRRGG